MTGVKMWLLIALIVLAGLFVLKQCRSDPIQVPDAVVELQDSLRKSNKAHAQQEERLIRAADSATEEAIRNKRRADHAVKTANYFKRIADSVARMARRSDSLRTLKVARIVYDSTKDSATVVLSDTLLVVDTASCVDSSWKTAYAARTQEAHQLRLALLHKDSALIAQLAATELERQRADENGARLARTEVVVKGLQRAIDDANKRCYVGPIKCRTLPKILGGVAVVAVTVKATEYVLKHWVK